jgi:hypothetical protein
MQTFAEAEAWFARHVDRSGECWPWIGPAHTMASGHARIYWRPSHRHEYAHRVALFIERRVWGYPMVLHSRRCTPLCCRVEHLRIGSALENARDRDAVGARTPYLLRGPDNPLSALTHADVEYLVAARAKGISVRQLSLEIGVSTGTIYSALRRASTAAVAQGCDLAAACS